VKINMKLSKKTILAIFALIIISVVLIFYFIQKNGSSEKIGQEKFKVKKGNVTHFTEQTGIIKAQVGAIVKVGTRATGTLTHLGYQVGDYVKKGELIARIDDREILANIRNNKAIVEEQKRDLDSKNAQYAYSKLNYERELRLLEKEFTTRDSVDRAKKELDMAIAQVELGKAKVKEASEKLTALEVSHSYTKIYAPISGYVSTVSTQEGETVVSGLSAAILITIIDPGKLEMWIYVDETDIGRTKTGVDVEYWVDAYHDKRFKGKISMIYPQPEIKDNIVYYLAIVKIDPNDTVLITGVNAGALADLTAQINLSDGTILYDTVIINVTSTMEYARLIDLSFGNGVLSPAFNPDILLYTVSGNKQEKLTTDANTGTTISIIPLPTLSNGTSFPARKFQAGLPNGMVAMVPDLNHKLSCIPVLIVGQQVMINTSNLTVTGMVQAEA